MANVYGKPSSYLKKMDARYYRWHLILGLLLIMSVFFFYALLTTLNFHSLKDLLLTSGIFISVLIIVKTLYKKLKKASGQYHRGLKGEKSTCLEMLKVSPAYTVFQDIKFGRKSNIDFVVAGPGGIFIVEVKNHKGRVGFDGEELTLNRKKFKEKNIIAQARGEALALHEYIKKKTMVKRFVRPILVFSNYRARLRTGDLVLGSVVTVEKKELPALFSRLPRIIGDSDLEKIKKALLRLVDKRQINVCT